MFTGYNTLSMATMLPPGGKVVACDITDKYLKEINSQQYFEEVGKCLLSLKGSSCAGHIHVRQCMYYYIDTLWIWQEA